ncbi:FAD binding domain-containing protein [Ferrovibrio sp.]|uniref:FAD binding domain-containing protein n=1 Tax=Ferrovibrio sp. TaxID=1917215 RepID=UPI003D2AFCAB
MHSFQYSRAKAVDDAIDLLKVDNEAKVISGGMSLLPAMKLRLAAPSALVDVTRIENMKGIAVDAAGVIRIGAATTHFTVNQSEILRARLPSLSDLAGGIGDVQVRYRGTIGGSLANNDPAADYPSAALALDATIITDRRRIKADDFFRGLFETALEPNELIIAVEFPIPRRSVYLKFPNMASRFAIAGVYLARFDKRVRLAVTGAMASVARLTDYEQALERDFSVSAIETLTIPDSACNNDVHASSGYRAHLVGVLAKRAVLACVE